jgi:hypothetical protein
MLILQGEDKARLIEPIYQQCDPRLSVESLYDEVDHHYVYITKQDIKNYLYRLHPENRRAPYVRATQRQGHEHGGRAYQNNTRRPPGNVSVRAAMLVQLSKQISGWRARSHPSPSP